MESEISSQLRFSKDIQNNESNHLLPQTSFTLPEDVSKNSAINKVQSNFNKSQIWDAIDDIPIIEVVDVVD